MSLGLLTPFPRGEMPEDVRRCETGPPYGRLELDTRPTGWVHNGDRVVLDKHTGQFFAIKDDLPCGLGCRCAAEARWIGAFAGDAPEDPEPGSAACADLPPTCPEG